MFYKILLIVSSILVYGCQSNGSSHTIRDPSPAEWQVIYKKSKSECPKITGTYQMQGKQATSYYSQDPNIRFTDIWYDVIHTLPYDAHIFTVVGVTTSDFAIGINGAKLSFPNIFNEISKYPNKNIYCENGAIVLSMSKAFTGMHSGKIHELRNFYFFPTADGSLAVLKKSTFKSSFEKDDTRVKWSLFSKVK